MIARVAQRMSGWIGWIFFADLIDGLSLTLSYMFSKTVTERYPDDEKWMPFPRYRGHHFLKSNAEGKTNCVACELCAKICPCRCITVVPHEDEDGERHPSVFEIDLGRCLFCGLCEDACPADAIALGRHYEFCEYDNKALVVGRDALMAMPGKTERGGEVVPARLTTGTGAGAGVIVTTTGGEGADWWRNIRRR